MYLPRRIEQDGSTRSSVRSLFSSRNSLCCLDTDAYDRRHEGVLWGSLAVRLPAFLQLNLGRTFGGTMVNSTCVFEVSAKEVSHDT